jgi:formylglycine-generating enzyme
MKRIFYAGIVILAMSRSSLSAATPPSQPGATFQECAQCPEMIVIPSGRFMMGTGPTERGHSSREAPLHEVRITKSFAIGVYAVTRAEYTAFVQQTQYPGHEGCEFLDGQRQWALDKQRSWRTPGFVQTDRDPVVCVNWHDAQAYLSWLNEKIASANVQAGQPYRLPSEAEWEYVARAGTHTTFYWGNEASHEAANYGAEQCYPCGIAKQGKDQWDYTAPVGSFAANAFSVYDMSGNVWQWTEDCMHETFTDAPNDGSSWITPVCYNRVLRGGSWIDPPRFLRLAERNPWSPDHTDYANGFRVVRVLEQPN